MNEYEKATLKLKLIELAQTQTLIALNAMSVNSVEANIVADESLKLLDESTEFIQKIIK